MRISLHSFSFILAFIFSFTILFSQESISWEDLAQVEWSQSYNEDSGMEELVANFSDSLWSLNGKEVTISGYVIPLDGMGLSYALSKSSLAACFFCGKAGPETVLELKVRPKSVKSYDQNDVLLTFTGVLLLKASNPNGLNYTLDRAKRAR